MKLFLINLVACIFLIGCATYPKTYVSEKQYHDEYVDKSCCWIREKQITDKEQIKTIRRRKEYKADIRGVIIMTILSLPMVLVQPFCIGLGPAVASKSEPFSEIDNLKIELRMLEIVAKEKQCPKESDYEIITDKSHTSHLSH